MATQQQQMVPFDEGAKPRYVDNKLLSDTLDGYTSDGTSTMALRKVGFTQALLVQLTMDVVVASGTPVLNEEGLYSLIKRIQVIIGNNQAQPIDLNGAGLKHIQRLIGFEQWGGFDTPAIGKIVPNAKFYAHPVVASPTVNKWVFTFYVPFSVNLHQDRHLGMLPTASRGFTANLQIDWAKITDAVTGGVLTITNSKARVDTLSCDVPDFSKVAKPKFYIFARRSTTYGSVIPGQQKIEIPQGGILHTFGAVIKANALRTDKVNECGIVIAGNDQPMTQTLTANQADFQARKRLELPTGEFCFDLLAGNNEGASGSLRDTIDTTATGLLEVIVDVDSTADLSTNPSKNSITLIRTTQHNINVAI